MTVTCVMTNTEGDADCAGMIVSRARRQANNEVRLRAGLMGHEITTKVELRTGCRLRCFSYRDAGHCESSTIGVWRKSEEVPSDDNHSGSSGFSRAKPHCHGRSIPGMERL